MKQQRQSPTEVDHSAFPIQLDDLFTVKDLAAQYPGLLSEATLKWQLRFRHENGLDAACVKVGKKLLLSKRRYEHLFLTARAGKA